MMRVKAWGYVIAVALLLAACTPSADEKALSARVGELEGEVHTLQAQVAAMKARPQALTPAPAAPMSQEDAARAMTSAPAATTRFDARFAVHLASYRSEKEAAAGWRQMQARFKSLKDVQARVSTVDLGPGKGTFFRLKAGPYADEAAAKAACADLKKQGQGYCTPSDFGGTAVSG